MCDQTGRFDWKEGREIRCAYGEENWMLCSRRGTCGSHTEQLVMPKAESIYGKGMACIAEAVLKRISSGEKEVGEAPVGKAD